MPARKNSTLERFGLADRGTPDLFRSREEVRDYPRLPYSHAVRRAWKKIDLSAVLYVDRTPAAYFKEVAGFDETQAREWQRTLWNQGVAPILIVSAPHEVRVYSGLARPAQKGEPLDDAGRLVPVLTALGDELEARALIRSIETGRIYSDFPDSFNPERAVDRELIRNLSDLRDELVGQGGLKLSVAHALLGRLIFSSYLMERGIVTPDYLQSHRLPSASNLREFLERDGSVANLYRLFRTLKKSFNGDAFSSDLAGEEAAVEASGRIGRIHDLFSNRVIATGQGRLPFTAYDFSIIPIETISAIYEDFVKSEEDAEEDALKQHSQAAKADEKRSTKRSSGVYYTPPKLVETVVDMALEGWEQVDLGSKRVLDPACGSGVFLVSMFNRMAAEWLRRHPDAKYKQRAAALRRILTHNLYGVDRNKTACGITCFSLYLAMLDQLEPRDIEQLERRSGKVLPPLMRKRRPDRSVQSAETILDENFFSPDLALPADGFDLIVGNPPWVSRGEFAKKGDPAVNWWANYTDKLFPPKGPRLDQGQIAHAFMVKAPTHLRGEGRACFVLPAQVLFNKTDEFQKRFFGERDVQKIVNLCDLVNILFVGAKRPAVVMRYAPGSPRSDVIDYYAPKTSVTFLRTRYISISPDDLRSLRTADVVASAQRRKAPLFWKRTLWSTPRDLKLLDRLDRLRRLNSLVGKPGAGKRWMTGEGFQPRRGKKIIKPPSWTGDHLYIDAAEIASDVVALERDFERVGDRFQELHRPRDRRIYEPPLVLVSMGLNSRTLYVDFPAVFQHAFLSIKGEWQDADLLMLLAAVLSSDLAKYYFFHTAANPGVERDVMRSYEIPGLPFPLPEDFRNPEKALETVRRVAGEVRRLKDALFKSDPSCYGEYLRRAWKGLQQLIYSYYDVTEGERILIEDTVTVLKPSATPPGSAAQSKAKSQKHSVSTLEEPDRSQRETYATLLRDTLDRWGETDVPVSVRCLTSDAVGVAIVTLRLGETVREYAERPARDEVESELRRLATLLPKNRAGILVRRNLKVFDDTALHVLKPLELRYWTRSAALNDADEIMAAMLSPDLGGE